MIYTDSKYTKGGYMFPDRDINPSEKGEIYCGNWTKAIYSRYLKGKTAWPSSVQESWATLRSYARGSQNTDKYKTWLLDDVREDGQTYDSFDDAIGNSALGRKAKKEGWMNILPDVVSPAVKIMNSIHGMFDDVDFDMYVDVIDAKSKELQENEKWQKIVEGKFSSWQNQYKINAGIPIDEDVQLPKSEEEFNQMAAAEGFKLGIAKAMQKLIRTAVNDDSEWNDVVKKKLIDDFLTIGRAATKDYYCSESKRFKTKYVDAANVVIQYSTEYDFNDSEYAGYFTTWTISNLKLKRPDVAEAEWKKLAKMYVGHMGNPSGKAEFDNRYSSFDTTAGKWGYDEFKISVFEGEWIDTDYQKALLYKGVRGRETYHRIGYDTEIKPLTAKQIERGAEQKVTKVPKRRVYECSWVVGSDIVFDYGMVSMAPLDDDYKPTLRTRVEALQHKSLTEQLYPVYDQFMMAWLRYQNSMAKMIERGYAVNIPMLMNITDGDGKQISWNEILEMWKQTGVLPYAASLTGSYQGGVATPVTPIEGGLGTRLEESIKLFEWCFWMIENLTGLNPISLGSSPDPKAPVATTQMALQATSNALKPVILALLELKKSSATNVIRRIQIGVRNDKGIKESYAGVVGSSDIDALITAESDFVKYGLSLKYRPNEMYKEKLRQYIQLALQTAQTSGAGLDAPQAMYFEERIDQGADLMEIRQQIAYQINKNKQENFAMQQANIQKQNEGLMQMEQQKQQGEAQMKQMEADLTMAADNNSTNNQLRVDRNSNNSKYLAELMLAAQKEEEGTNV